MTASPPRIASPPFFGTASSPIWPGPFWSDRCPGPCCRTPAPEWCRCVAAVRGLEREAASPPPFVAASALCRRYRLTGAATGLLSIRPGLILPASSFHCGPRCGPGLLSPPHRRQSGPPCWQSCLGWLLPRPGNPWRLDHLRQANLGGAAESRQQATPWDWAISSVKKELSCRKATVIQSSKLNKRQIGSSK